MWQGLFQLGFTKSVATFICGLGVWFLVSLAVADIECVVPKPPPPTLRGLPGAGVDLTPGPPTTSEGCQTYGSFLFLPADNAPWILGLLAGAAGWLGETAWKEHQENKELPRPAPRDE